MKKTYVKRAGGMLAVYRHAGTTNHINALMACTAIVDMKGDATEMRDTAEVSKTMTEPTTPQLSESDVAELADMFPHAEYDPDTSEMPVCATCGGAIDDHRANCAVPLIHALIRDWRALTAENATLKNHWADTSEDLASALLKHEEHEQVNAALREQLAEETRRAGDNFTDYDRIKTLYSDAVNQLKEARVAAFKEAIEIIGGVEETDPECNTWTTDCIRALEAAATKQPCPDCAEAARLAYSDAVTPGFFNPKCARHQTERATTTKQPTEVKEGDDG